jgi:hypothetical protein
VPTTYWCASRTLAIHRRPAVVDSNSIIIVIVIGCSIRLGTVERDRLIGAIIVVVIIDVVDKLALSHTKHINPTPARTRSHAYTYHPTPLTAGNFFSNSVGMANASSSSASSDVDAAATA